MTKVLLRTLLYAVFVCLPFVSCKETPEFYRVEGNQFVLGDKPQYFIGTNMWYASRLALENPDRLCRELDTLCALGVKNLRIVATDGNYEGLDRVFRELRRRGMCAVLFLNNAWEWTEDAYYSYLERAGAGVQPRPATEGYNAYMDAMSAFALNEDAVALFHDYVRGIVSRYKDEPAVFSWQICNEPRPFSRAPEAVEAFAEYIRSTAALIKSIDRNHMVSTGNEGTMGCNDGDMELFRRIHSFEDVDYCTIHIWPYNWRWISEDRVFEDREEALRRVDEYIDGHLDAVRSLGKPLVVEEFGYPRDGFDHRNSSSTAGRDAVYRRVFCRVAHSAATSGQLAGCNFWAWSGFASQTPGHEFWQEGDDLCGDPFQEAQGLNGVYITDGSTLEIIRTATNYINMACCDEGPGAGRILSALRGAAAEGKILYGHQDDLMYGHAWNSADGSDPGFTRSDVRDVCGDYPAVLGLDLGGIELGDSCNLDGNNFDAMRLAARQHVQRGGIVTLSWHLRNPLTGGDAWDRSSTEAVASCLEGGVMHEKFLGWMDRLAEYVKSLEIPVIFRPWHEHSADFFWWGNRHCSAREYNELWRLTYNYLTEEKGLHDILWAISPNVVRDFGSWTERYPGDAYVDIIGLDFYKFDPLYGRTLAECLSFQLQMCAERGKIAALTETGYEGIPDPEWWTGELLPALEGLPIAYLLTWRNAPDRPGHFYGPFPGAECEQDFVKFHNSNNILFLNDIR